MPPPKKRLSANELLLIFIKLSTREPANQSPRSALSFAGSPDGRPVLEPHGHDFGRSVVKQKIVVFFLSS